MFGDYGIVCVMSIIILLITGYLLYRLIRYPIKTLGFVFKATLLLMLGFLVWFAYIDEAHSINQENQYCDIKTTLVRTVDED